MIISTELSFRFNVSPLSENNFNIEKEGLIIKELRVDSGYILKRRMPRARGMAYPIKKRTSHVFIQLDTIDNMPGKKNKVAKKEVVEAKAEKVVAKKAVKTKKVK